MYGRFIFVWLDRTQTVSCFHLGRHHHEALYKMQSRSRYKVRSSESKFVTSLLRYVVWLALRRSRVERKKVVFVSLTVACITGVIFLCTVDCILLHIWARKLQSLTGQKLRRLTSFENMFCECAFTGRCNRRYFRRTEAKARRTRSVRSVIRRRGEEREKITRSGRKKAVQAP